MAQPQGVFIPDAAIGGAEVWHAAIEQAFAFLEHDPMTAYRRVGQVEMRLRSTMARNPIAAAALEPWASYARMLRLRALAAKNEWLAQCVEREQKFRASERRKQGSPLPQSRPRALAN